MYKARLLGERLVDSLRCNNLGIVDKSDSGLTHCDFSGQGHSWIDVSLKTEEIKEFNGRLFPLGVCQIIICFSGAYQRRIAMKM